MKVREVINKALYRGNVISQGLQTVPNEEASVGLELLNDILGEKAADTNGIPYFTRTTFPGVVGQEEYFIPNMIELSTLTVELDDVRYPMTSLTRDKYFGRGRVNNISSLPYTYYSERTFDTATDTAGTTVWVYFEPSTTSYTFEAVGRNQFGEVTFDTTISETTERFYISYLIYELAYRLCEHYKLPFQSMSTLIRLRRMIKRVNTTDVSLKLYNQFDGRAQLNYAIINFGMFVP